MDKREKNVVAGIRLAKYSRYGKGGGMRDGDYLLKMKATCGGFGFGVYPLGEMIQDIRIQPTQEDVEHIVDDVVGSNVDDDMVFPEETWTEAADRMEPDYPAVAVALRFAQERHRELDPVLLV